ncbi:MAG: hypothetical protein N3G20_10470 [Verrucomicrobiae bacterium]|jgi:hypothetical protein|nr:hypothetical protein [Verrucomicrobiae bacterium]
MHYRCTSPWDDGYRLISNAGLAAYDQQMAGLKAEYDKLVQAFGEQYAMWCEQAYLMHRTTYDPADYPPWDELKSRFVFRVEHYPVPEASHFNQTLRGLYAAELESTIQARINAAVADTWERVLAPVRHMAETLINPEQVFRDSLVGNIREALDMIPSLICDTRPAFKQAVETIRSQLADLDPDVLRHNLVKRRDAAERAAAIVSRFGALGSNRKISSNPAT